MPSILRSTLVALSTLIALPATTLAQPDWDKFQVEATELAQGVYMLTGAGGQIGVSVGDDGVMLIDDQFGQLSDKIKFAIAQITDRPVVFVLNTHWHGDHTSGNENFAADGAWIMAHHNVRTRMSMDQVRTLLGRTDEAKPESAWPVLTFDSELDLHINDQDIHVFHVENAHTDGDAIVHFRNRNVIHAGDVFWNGAYPLIDTDTGGNARGMLRAVGEIMLLVDGSTKIVPGHGPVGNREDLRAFRDMLQTAIRRVEKLIAEGKTLQQAVDAKPMADYDEAWGGAFINPKKFIEMVYLSLRP